MKVLHLQDLSLVDILQMGFSLYVYNMIRNGYGMRYEYYSRMKGEVSSKWLPMLVSDPQHGVGCWIVPEDTLETAFLKT